jgi:hypothetical protein
MASKLITLEGIFDGTDVNKTAPLNKLAKLVTAPPKPQVDGFVVATAVNFATPGQPSEPNVVTDVALDVIVTTAVGFGYPEAG